jgi:hypothetical protein
MVAEPLIVGLDVAPKGPSPLVGESELSRANLYVNLHQKSKSRKIKKSLAKIRV